MKITSASSSLQNNYIPQLDGLRGLAILLVVTFHYFGFLKIFSLGWTGVDLFFVLSGYLITSRLYQLKKDKKYFYNFYLNRALRILPVYYLTLTVFYSAFNVLLDSKNLFVLNYYNNNLWSFFLFFENWTFINNPPVTNHLQHFWSLAIEEQFYLVWPLFIFIFLHKKYFNKIIILLLSAIVIARSSIYFHHPNPEDYSHYFYNTFCRMDGFIIGGFLYILQQRKKLAPYKYLFLIPAIFLAQGIIVTNQSHTNIFISTIGYTILALFFAGIINFITINSNSLLSKIFQRKWLKFIGKISYGLYIYHWIILVTLQSKIYLWLQLFFTESKTFYWISILICLFISVVTSIVSYFYFEKFFLKLKR